MGGPPPSPSNVAQALGLPEDPITVATDKVVTDVLKDVKVGGTLKVPGSGPTTLDNTPPSARTPEIPQVSSPILTPTPEANTLPVPRVLTPPTLPRGRSLPQVTPSTPKNDFISTLDADEAARRQAEIRKRIEAEINARMRTPGRAQVLLTPEQRRYGRTLFGGIDLEGTPGPKAISPP